MSPPEDGRPVASASDPRPSTLPSPGHHSGTHAIGSQPALWRRALVVRVLPMLAFMLVLACRSAMESDVFGRLGWSLDVRWLYALQAGLAALALAFAWRDYGELASQLRPSAAELLAAVGLGLVVFGLWITLDKPWMVLGTASATFLPLTPEGHPDLALVALRVLGSVLVVPIMEELFWRSFLMRWIDDARFESVAPGSVTLKAIVLSTFVFVLAHTQWLAAAIAGLAYAGLYVRTGKLWVAIVAHAVTNAALAAWVATRGQWQFW